MTVVAGPTPSQVYGVGPRTFGPFNLADGATQIRATFTRENWPLTFNDVVLKVNIGASLDGGQTYPYFAAGEIRGGVWTDRLGNVRTSSSVGLTGVPLAPGRKVNFTVEVMAPLSTSVTVETF